jgi:hypothetical protein
VQFIRSAEEMTGPGIYLTNYESVRDGKLDPNLFTAVSLDEASVLRSFGSKTYQTFLTLFDEVPYRFVATATPSPNRYKELIHYAGFLGIMDTGQRSPGGSSATRRKANNLTLYPHKSAEFWLWLNTWATFVQSPADLGFDATGYDLPELDVTYHEVAVDHDGAAVDRDGQAHLFRGGALGVSEAFREKRDSSPPASTRPCASSTATPPPTRPTRSSSGATSTPNSDAIEKRPNSRGITYSSVARLLPSTSPNGGSQAWRTARPTR